MNPEEIRAVIEAILFVSDEPQPAGRIAQLLPDVDLKAVTTAVEEIRQAHESSAHGIQVIEVAGGYQLATKEDCRPFLDQYFEKRRKARISTAALETLAIVAYRQPITRGEIEAVRGVNVDGVVHSLLERRLIKIAGRKEAPGQPFLYRTTAEFLNHFGLRSLSDLPQLEALMRAFESSGAEQLIESAEENSSEMLASETESEPSSPDQAAE
jgi:segregation and condensation protein B